jgi:hypothetical protein
LTTSARTSTEQKSLRRDILTATCCVVSPPPYYCTYIQCASPCSCNPKLLRRQTWRERPLGPVSGARPRTSDAPDSNATS